VIGYRFILDSSALLAYADEQTQVHVGEKISEAADEHRMVGIPGSVLAAVVRAAMKQPAVVRRLRLLAGVGNVRVLPFTVSTWDSAVDFAGYLATFDGRADLATAAWEADAYSEGQATEDGQWDAVYVLTADPAGYDVEDGPPFIDVLGE
jgi:hypothetical protein